MPVYKHNLALVFKHFLLIFNLSICIITLLSFFSIMKICRKTASTLWVFFFVFRSGRFKEGELLQKEKIIVFCGKGGVGKTSLSAAFVRILGELHPDKRILAIDADPASGLSTALGIEASLTVDDIRKRIADNITDGNTGAAAEILSESEFHMMEALSERDNISFLSIGRPEGAGCYCKINAYLKEVITAVASNFDYVVIDGEAGIEQINRRVIENPGCLIFVSDASKKGIKVINTIRQVADELLETEKCGVIFNRISPSFDVTGAELPGELLAVIGDDDAQRENDMEGKSVFEMDDGSPVMQGARQAVSKLFGDGR